MDLEELRAFVTVVETGSFVAAERALKMPRATLRRRVDALETRAGVSLLQRHRQGVAATEAGAVLAERGRTLIQEAKAVVTSVRDLGSEPSGVVRLLLPVGLPPHLLVPIFAAMRAAYPKLSVRARLSADPIGGLLDDIDVAVHFGAESPKGPWLSQEVARVRESPIAHADYLRRRGTPTSLDELAGHEIFAWEVPGGDAREWPLRSGGTFRIDPALVVSDPHLAKQCVIAGLGIGLVPGGPLPPGVDERAIVPVLGDVVGRDLVVRLTVPKVLADVPKVRAILAEARAFAGAFQPAPSSPRA